MSEIVVLISIVINWMSLDQTSQLVLYLRSDF